MAGKWSARWIWHTKHDAEGMFWAAPRAPATAVNTFSMLRRIFRWDGVGTVTARLTADVYRRVLAA